MLIENGENGCTRHIWQSVKHNPFSSSGAVKQTLECYRKPDLPYVKCDNLWTQWVQLSPRATTECFLLQHVNTNPCWDTKVRNRTTVSIPWGLFQKLSSGGALFFSRPLHPQDTHGVRAPRPPGHVSALINPPHYGSNMPWPPRTSYPSIPHPSDTLLTKYPPPHTGQKSVCAPPPEDNFWNSPDQGAIACLSQFKPHPSLSSGTLYKGPLFVTLLGSCTFLTISFLEYQIWSFCPGQRQFTPLYKLSPSWKPASYIIANTQPA